MRNLTIAATICLTVLTSRAAAQAPAPRSPLIVHEWGTFTSVQGSDGVVLEGVHREEELVPKFVHSLSEGQEARVALGPKGLPMPPRHVTQKMETPILYFHSDVPRRVKVRVGFEQGLITQWYPIASARGVDGDLDFHEVVDFRKIQRSHVEWDVDVLPGEHGKDLSVPAAAPDEPWQMGREVAAARVRTRGKWGEEQRAEGEHYLFYRGLGTFALPVQVRAARGGKGVLRTGGERLPFAVVTQVERDGGRLQVLHGGGDELAFDLAAQPRLGSGELRERLHELVQAALVAQGLRLDEARAMVRTWSRSWFLTPGSRVLWFVPRARVDAILPLSITPAPDGVVRVLVGRLEFFTPEVEDAVENALLADGGETELQAQGRLLEPMLRRALARTAQVKVKERANAVLAKLP
jgi:hypothetical protein